VSRLDFGQAVVGATPTVQSATLKNAGPGGTRLTLLNAVGPDAAAFSVAAGSCAIGDVLFEGQTCRVDIKFAPGSSGTKSANVQVVSTGSFPSDLGLTGIGLGGPNPGLALSARTLQLGTIRVGALSAPAEVTVAANGAGVVRVTGFSATSGFTVQSKSCPALPFTLQAGSECTVTVQFAPQAAGAATGQLTVTSDATNGTTQLVALSGTGEAAPDLSSGGCSISQGKGDAGVDPTLALLALLALGGLAHRRHLRRSAARRAA
jgi:MYXO-CTERM domain-containing protein